MPAFITKNQPPLFKILQKSEVAIPNQEGKQHIYLYHFFIPLWNILTGRAVHRSAAFVLAAATTPSLAAMRDQFIAGLGYFWNCKCGPMWFIISLDPPPSTWRRKYRLSDKWPWPAWKTTLLTCCSRAVYSSGYPLLGSKSFFLVLFTSVQVLIYTWVQPLNGLHALFWDLSVSNASVSTSSKFWTDMQFWFFPSLTKPDTVSHPVSAWNIRRVCDIS